jgi:hypothetical protein
VKAEYSTYIEECTPKHNIIIKHNNKKHHVIFQVSDIHMTHIHNNIFTHIFFMNVYAKFPVRHPVLVSQLFHSNASSSTEYK